MSLLYIYEARVAMFCQTEREIAMFDFLVERFPNKHPQLLELIAWCGINRPERLEEILEKHKEDGEDSLIDLADFDIKTLIPQEPRD
jgi:tetraacyldisaccharide-1-P 4'-kinase